MTTHGRISPLRPLREMRVELLRGCPLRCVHCSAFAAPRHPLCLPTARVLDLIDEFAVLGGERVTLTGDELFEYTTIEDVVRRCHAKGLRTRLFSSGVVSGGGPPRVVEGDVLRRLVPLVDGVAYSIYGTSAERHDRMTRTPGSLGMTIEALRRTVTIGIEAEIHFVPTRTNYTEVVAVAELAASLGVGRVGILRFVLHGRGGHQADALALTRGEHLWLRDTIAALRAQYPAMRIHVGFAYNALNLGDPIPCTAAIDQIVVGADGRISACSAFDNIDTGDAHGNILEHPLEIVWERSAFLTRVRRALDRSDSCTGCLAQKAIVPGRTDASILDPLEELAG